MISTDIANALKNFSDEILYKCSTHAEWVDVDTRLNDFIEENNLSDDQLTILHESGALDMLAMIVL